MPARGGNPRVGKGAGHGGQDILRAERVGCGSRLVIEEPRPETRAAHVFSQQGIVQFLHLDAPPGQIDP